jgi:hypothetical protein
MMGMEVGGAFVGLISLVALVVTVYGAWQGVARAGYAGAWSLLLLVPFVNIIAVYIFAFATWPAERRAPVTQWRS